MKAGKYFVGDLCYIFKGLTWDEVCDVTIQDDTVQEGEFTLKDGTSFVMYKTSFGDGTYEDQFGREYGVDSGTLGCVSLDDHPEFLTEAESIQTHDLGQIVDFDEDFFTSGDDGDIRIGNIHIDTDEYVVGHIDVDDDEEIRFACFDDEEIED